MSLSMTATIELKIFKLRAVLLEHLISQLPLSMTATLHTTFVFNLVSKLILEFFFSNKVFWSKTQFFLLVPSLQHNFSAFLYYILLFTIQKKKSQI